MSRISSRRGFLREAGLSALGAAGACLVLPHRALGAPAKGRKPNIVFILIDDLGWSDLACYGNPFHETPNIDRLAAQGMRFTDAYAACPVCSPTRASIITGQYPARVGITDFIPGNLRPWAKLKMPVNRQQYLPLAAVSIAEALAPAGYVSGAFGKWHLGGRKFFPDRQGFDAMLVSVGRHFKFQTTPETPVEKHAYRAEVLTERAIDFMKQHKDRPFFLYLSHHVVHTPLEARQELIAKYENKAKSPERPCNPIYAAMVEHVDRSVGRILDELRELGLEENTVVVFMSDNGGLRQRLDGEGPIVTTNAPLRAEKGTLYEGGIREPLIVRWPGLVQPGSQCNTPVSSVDFYPTFLDMAGTTGDPSHVIDGESMAPLLKQAGPLGRDALFWHYPHYHHSTPAGAIRKGPWKLIEFFEDGRVELYNLERDIGEKQNLASEMPEKAAALERQLAGWRTSIGAAMPTPNPDFDAARQHEWGKR